MAVALAVESEFAGSSGFMPVVKNSLDVALIKRDDIEASSYRSDAFELNLQGLQRWLSEIKLLDQWCEIEADLNELELGID